MKKILYKEKFSRGKMKKYCIEKYCIRWKVLYKKRAGQKSWGQNFILENFNENFFLKVNIFWTSIYSQQKNISYGKRDDDKTFEVKNIIIVKFLILWFCRKN